MEAYVISVIAASLIATVIGILTPRGERGGIAAHVKLLTSLFMICVLVSPLKGVIQRIEELSSGDWRDLFGEVAVEEDYRAQMEHTMQEASTEYFTQMLTQALESQFDMQSGTVRCCVEWSPDSENLHPTRVTVILSGASIWKNPHAIESFVTELLDCTCVTAIE